MTAWLRFFTSVILLATIAYALLPLVELFQDLSRGRVFDLKSQLKGVNGDRVKIAVNLTYLASVPLTQYTLKLEPKCPACTPIDVRGEALKPGDTVTLELEMRLDANLNVEFSALIAGLYRVRVEVREWSIGGVGLSG